MTARRLTIIATGPSGPPEELDPLRAAGHEVVIGRPLDTPARRAYSESDLIEQVRAADVLLAGAPDDQRDLIARLRGGDQLSLVDTTEALNAALETQGARRDWILARQAQERREG